jgi:hypothetical protein
VAMVCNNEHEENGQKNVEIKETEYTCARSVSGRRELKELNVY